MSVQDLFDPASVAVIGASRSSGKIGHRVTRNLDTFDGEVHPVNPNAEGDLCGNPFVPSVTAIEGGVDLALLCVPVSAVLDVLEECGEVGVGAAVVYAGGFAEADEEGATRQERLVEFGREHEIALLGPNTSGLLVPGTGLYASFVPHVERVASGNLAVVAQSGGIAHALAFQAHRENRGLSAVVGLGNRADTGFRPIVEYLGEDSTTDAVVLHVEGTEDARGLLESCGTSDVPVVGYPVGEEDVTAFAESHTGALTGNYDLYRAGFRQHGVPVVESTTELLDAGHALANSPRPRGPNVGVVTAQAGPGIVLADRLQGAGAILPSLTDDTRAHIGERLPGITYTENPIDTGRPTAEFGEIVVAVARDERVDVVVVYQLYEEGVDYPVDALEDLPEAVGKPVVFVTDGPEEQMAPALDQLADAGIPTFRTPERGGAAAATLVRYANLHTRDCDGSGDDNAAGSRADDTTGGGTEATTDG